MKERHPPEDRHERLQPCVIFIDWEHDDRTFDCGDAVQGHLRIESIRNCRCRSLKIANCWYGGWDEVPDREPCHDRTEMILVEDQPLTAGVNTFPFSFVSPAPPPSYSGRRLRIRWFLEATAEIDDGTVIRVSDEFRLTSPLARSGTKRFPPMGSQRPWTGRGIEAFGLFSFALALLGLAILGAALGGTLVFNQDIGWWGFVFLFVPVLVYGAWRCFRRGLHIVRLTRRLGTIRIDVPKTASRSETIDVAISIAPRSEVRVNRLTAKLVCQESCLRGSEYDYSENCTAFETVAKLIAEATTLVAAQEYRFTSEFTVPPDAPLPFAFDRFSVGWGVVFRLETSDGQEWVGGSSVHLNELRTGPGASHDIH